MSSTSNRFDPSSGRNCAYAAYFPINFSAQDYESLGEYVQSAALIFDQLYKFRHYQEYLKADDYVDLSYDYCDRLIYKFRETIKILLDKKILERTSILLDHEGFEIKIKRGKLSPYDAGKHRSFGYRFIEPDYRQNYHQIELTDHRITRKLGKFVLNKPILRWLQTNNERLQAIQSNPVEILKFANGNKELAENYEERLQAIRDGRWIFHIDDFSGRVHNNLTGLKRETRKYLRVDEQSLVEIDIPCSQWLFLALFCTKKKVDEAEKFLRACENDLYSLIASKGNWTRNEVKEMLTKQCLFSSNRARCQYSPIKKAFDAEFPTIAEFIRKQKDGKKTQADPKPWNKLARQLQSLERKFIIDKVCKRISKEKPNLYIGTIHDSILTLSDNADFVLKIMLNEFAKIGAAPKLSIKRLA